MATTLYMIISINGLIAGPKDETPWSKETWKECSKIVKKFGNSIIGYRTYKLMQQAGEFEKLGYPTIVVLTKKKLNVKGKNIYLAHSPKEAIRVLRSKGFSKFLIGGGGKTNNGFLQQDLIDEIILDVEPIIIGRGIPLLEGKFQVKLKFSGAKKISRNIIRLRYKVQRG